MSDISMCGDRECPSRGSCHRYCARPSQVQSYASFLRESDANTCDDFLPWEVGDMQLRDVEK